MIEPTISHGTYEMEVRVFQQPHRVTEYSRLRWRHYEYWRENGILMGRWLWEYVWCGKGEAR